MAVDGSAASDVLGPGAGGAPGTDGAGAVSGPEVRRRVSLVRAGAIRSRANSGTRPQVQAVGQGREPRGATPQAALDGDDADPVPRAAQARGLLEHAGVVGGVVVHEDRDAPGGD